MRQARQYRVTASYWGGRIERSAVVEAETPQMAALTAIWKRRLPKEIRRTAWARIPVFWFSGTPDKDTWPHPVEYEKLPDGSTSVTIVWGGDDRTAGLLQLTVIEIEEGSAADTRA